MLSFFQRTFPQQELVILSLPLSATTWYVNPGENIQDAIDIATGGDTVIVKAGTYTGARNKILDFGGKDLILKSESGPELTIIDCEDTGRGIIFDDGETALAVVYGFTITRGRADTGGGIACSGSDPTITNCIIKENRAEAGAGIYCSFSSPAIGGCSITGNTALGGSPSSGGGGIYSDSYLTIMDCTINNNRSEDGGGLYLSSGVTLTNTLISNNSVVDTANPLLGGNGGGLFVSDYVTYVQLTNCRISGNLAVKGGGIAYSQLCGSTITNCIIDNNSAGALGGGIDLNSSALEVINSTFSGNYATISGDGILCVSSNLSITNCVFWDHTSNISPSGSPLVLTVTYSVLYGDSGQSYFDTGCIDADPLFLSPGTGDYSLRPGSPCIDAANGDSAPVLDLEGRTRWDDPATANTGIGTQDYCDIGAHEYEIAYYVNRDTGSDTHDGIMPFVWNGHGPKRTIQAGIDTATSGSKVNVAAGTYTSAGNRDLDFNGKILCLVSEEGAEKTIIDCEDTGRGIYLNSGETADAAIVGFTITRGFAAYGAAVYCDGSSPTFSDCHLINNTATNSGGAIYAAYSSLNFTNCTIRGNTALESAAAYFYDCDNPVFVNCLISENIATSWGAGGLLYTQSGGLLKNCTISGNASQLNGGGMYCWNSSPDIVNSIIWGNSPNNIYVYSGSPSATYSDIEGGTGQSYFDTGCIDTDPLFVRGALHDYYLSQTASGQSVTSPCVDTGNDTAAAGLGLDQLSTRSDGMPDAGIVDMGYHAPYKLWIDSITKSGTDIIIHWNALPDVDYSIQFSVDFSNWIDTGIGQTTPFRHADPLDDFDAVIYRVRSHERRR